MNKSQLISIIRSCDTAQAQARYHHIMIYLQAHKNYPRIKSIVDKTTWAQSINSDFAHTVTTMISMGYHKLTDWRMVARYLTQYHQFSTPTVVRIPHDITAPSSTEQDADMILHNITNGIDINRGDERYHRTLDSDLQKIFDLTL